MALLLVSGLAVLGTDTGSCAAPEKTARKLGSLAPLPMLSASMNISSEEVQHPELSLGTNYLASKITGWRGEIQGVPGDADRYHELGSLLKLLHRGSEATVAFSNAATLYRSRAESRPEDGPLQARCADVLQEINRVDEAEHLLREAIRRMPRDWSCQVEMGQLLLGRSWRAAVGTNVPTWTAPPAGRKLTPADREVAEKNRVEARRYFERAVELAPDEPRPYLCRVLHRTTEPVFRKAMDQPRGLSPDRPHDFARSMGSDENCADMARVARLSRTNHAAIAYWAWCEALPAMMKAEGGKPLSFLSSQRRQNFFEALRMLEALAKSASKVWAAAAFEMVGVLKAAVEQDAPAAIAAFRRAVASDSSRDRAWDCIAGLTVQSGQPADLVDVGQEYRRHSDTPRAHIVLAKAYDKAGQSDQALAEALAAVKLDPRDATAQLATAALLLRRAGAKDAGQPWKQSLASATRLLDGMEESELRQSLRVNYLLNQAIALGVDGDPAAARKLLRRALESSGGDDRVQEKADEIGLTLSR